MQLFVMVLNREELLEEVLTLFVEIGVKATIIDSTGMGKVLVDRVPIFAGFKDLLQGGKPHNKTIFSVVSERLAGIIPKELEKAFGERGEGAFIYFFLPVKMAWGIREADTGDRE